MALKFGCAIVLVLFLSEILSSSSASWFGGGDEDSKGKSKSGPDPYIKADAAEPGYASSTPTEATTSPPTTTSTTPTTSTSSTTTTSSSTNAPPTLTTAPKLPGKKEPHPNKPTQLDDIPSTQATTTSPSTTTQSPLPQKSSMAYQCAQRSRETSLELIEKLKVELDYNKYFVSLATYRKAEETMKFLLQDIHQFLGEECRPSAFPHFHNKLPLPEAEGQTSEREPCETSRAAVDRGVEKFEELILANQDFRKHTAKVQINLKKELENLQKDFEKSLEDTLRDSTHGESLEKLSLIFRKAIPDVFTPHQKDKPAVVVPQATAHPVLKRPSEIRNSGSKPSKTGSPQVLPVVVSKPKAVEAFPDFDTEFDTTNDNVEVDTAPSMNVIRTSGENTTGNVPLPPTSPKEESYDYGSSEIPPTIAEKFHEIEEMIRNNKLLDMKQKAKAFIELIDQVEETGLNENPEIFELACLIKNSRHGAHVLPYVKHLFPEPVQQVVWGVENKIELVKNETRYKIFADPENNVQKIVVMGEGIQASPLEGGIWKFFPMNEGTAFMLFNVQRKAVLTTVAGVNATLRWPQEAEVTMDSEVGSNITMLQKRLEYLWSIKLACDPTDDDTVSTERTLFGEKDLKCFVMIESQLYTNLALNVNQVGCVKLLSKLPRPGFFKIKDAKV